MQRKIIQIDESKCNGCGLCIPNCPEGAIQLIDGKARLISDLCCDGLGACLGHCPEGAISIIERDAQPYDEIHVMEKIIAQGPNVVLAHLKHLHDHGEKHYLGQALSVLKQKEMPIPQGPWDQEAASGHEQHQHHHGGCPGAQTMDFTTKTNEPTSIQHVPSQLKQWPIQLHLISPNASYFQGRDLLVAADCVAYALGDFHSQYLQGRSLVIACPKLDEGQDIYEAKFLALIEEAQVTSITVLMMQVPCCRGLLQMVLHAAEKSTRKVPIRYCIVGIQGNILNEQTIQ